jgi:catechol 2,3-dioxygenase-like lactoylglutathione lyase family enzyme
MLGKTNIVAFAPTSDYTKAREFYEGKLGLKFVSQDEFALVLDANGIMVRISKVPDHKPAQFTILGWNVKNIEDTVRALQKNGVKFERYSFLEQDSLGVWTAPGGDKVAWFQDPDGNILSLSQHGS